MFDEEEEALYQRLVEKCSGGNKEKPKPELNPTWCTQLYYCIFGKK
jgi:hypothetical protein